MLSSQTAAPECWKDSEPVIQGQVPWRVYEWPAAGGGGQEQREADVHRLGTTQLGNVPHPDCHWARWGFRGWETSLTQVVTGPAGGSGLSLG